MNNTLVLHFDKIGMNFHADIVTCCIYGFNNCRVGNQLLTYCVADIKDRRGTKVNKQTNIVCVLRVKLSTQAKLEQ